MKNSKSMHDLFSVITCKRERARKKSNYGLSNPNLIKTLFHSQASVLHASSLSQVIASELLHKWELKGFLGVIIFTTGSWETSLNSEYYIVIYLVPNTYFDPNAIIMDNIPTNWRFWATLAVLKAILEIFGLIIEYLNVFWIASCPPPPFPAI